MAQICRSSEVGIYVVGGSRAEQREVGICRSCQPVRAARWVYAVDVSQSAVGGAHRKINLHEGGSSLDPLDHCGLRPRGGGAGGDACARTERNSPLEMWNSPPIGRNSPLEMWNSPPIGKNAPPVVVKRDADWEVFSTNGKVARLEPTIGYQSQKRRENLPIAGTNRRRGERIYSWEDLL
eukprot:858429-Prorocentrum_minimum.AAC.1